MYLGPTLKPLDTFDNVSVPEEIFNQRLLSPETKPIQDLQLLSWKPALTLNLRCTLLPRDLLKHLVMHLDIVSRTDKLLIWIIG